ncbi:MAG: 50S ribosomal protein L4 [Clostridia bacterium]|nr:50S ribosomal protein L4 [Clostridia bacterium]MBQ2737562.1 50S ribosomal protein L4 [Clostridia bacterium]MBQ8290158.1 50S ribosomal protein L4 [Clostridia bacterium]
MPNMKVVDMAGKEVGEITLSSVVFGQEKVNNAVLHTAVRAYLLNQRQGTQSTLTRTEVSGGGRKPWKQKGTGHARQGSTRSPQWTHGGVALGPKPRSYRVELDKRTRRAALFSALTTKVVNDEMIVVDAITANEYKTKTMVAMLDAIGAAKKTLIVLPAVDSCVIKSCDNIEGVKTTQWNSLNVYDILNCDTIVFAKDAVAKIEEVYSK